MPPAEINGTSIQRVTVCKLLGLNINSDLKWKSHINKIVQRANLRLHFLRRLRNAGFSLTELLLYYSSCIRPVLEYACPAWATSVYEYQKETLDTAQKLALAIITGFFRPISSTIYESQLM